MGDFFSYLSVVYMQSLELCSGEEAASAALYHGRLMRRGESEGGGEVTHCTGRSRGREYGD